MADFTDRRVALMAGTDIPITECRLILHQPTIKEISFLGETVFFTGIQTLTLHKSMFVQHQGKDVLDNVNNFQIFMTVMNDNETKEKKENVKMVLKLLFPNYSIIFSPQSLIFQPQENDSSDNNEAIIIDTTNFEILQSILRDVFCLKTGPMDQTAFNPINEQAKEIADKLMRGRQRVAQQKGTANTSVFSLYISILTVGLHSMSLHDLLNCTVYQLYDLMERYSLYLTWDIDVRTRLAGGKPDSQPENWMKNIH